MDEANEYQQQDDMQDEIESTTQVGNSLCSTFLPNPANIMQENANIRQENDFEEENEIRQSNEFPPPPPPGPNINGEETNVNDDNLNTFGKRKSMDMVDRANLPLPPRPPGYAAPPKIPDEELPLMPASSLNSNQSKGIQEVILIKDDRGKLGLKLKNIKTGVYVMEVTVMSPASLAGILPGDRILQINGTKVDKFDDEKLHGKLSGLSDKPIRMLINKRPLEKTITVVKDEKGRLGITLRSMKIHKVAKNSPADVKGLSTDFYIIDVNGIKVRGKSEEEIQKLLKDGNSVSITVMPYYLYEPLMKQLPIR